MVTDLRRIFSALVTPMRDDESIDVEVLRELVERQIARGVEGFYCCGSSGEALLLSLDERSDVVRAVVDQVNGRVPVIAHVGTIRTRDAVSLARGAADAGVAAVSLIPPYYYNWTPDEVTRYYQTVLDAVPLPVLLYNIPQFTRITFDKHTAGDLFAHERLLGMKHTSHDMYALERMTSAYPDKIFFNGFDEIYLSALAAGATATVGTTVNLQVELFIRVRDAFARGDMAEARRVQSQINDVVETLVAHGVFQSAKYLSGYDGVPTGPCRAPFRPLSAEDMAALDALRERLSDVIEQGDRLLE
jgi:N-acetylneuraminate lyase